MREYEKIGDGHERVIAALLRHGTGLASLVIGVGLAIQWLLPGSGAVLFGLGGSDLVKAGVALFIVLPVCRLAVMLVLFLRARDNTYAAISALVLAIIGVAFIASL